MALRTAPTRPSRALARMYPGQRPQIRRPTSAPSRRTDPWTWSSIQSTMRGPSFMKKKANTSGISPPARRNASPRTPPAMSSRFSAIASCARSITRFDVVFAHVERAVGQPRAPFVDRLVESLGQPRRLIGNRLPESEDGKPERGRHCGEDQPGGAREGSRRCSSHRTGGERTAVTRRATTTASTTSQRSRQREDAGEHDDQEEPDPPCDGDQSREPRWRRAGCRSAPGRLLAPRGPSIPAAAGAYPGVVQSPVVLGLPAPEAPA